MRNPYPTLDLGRIPTRMDAKRKIIALLRWYRFAHHEIRRLENAARGIGLPVEPRVTAKLGVDDDDPEALQNLADLTEQQEFVVSSVSHYAGDLTERYVTMQKTVNFLRGLTPETEHKEAIEGFCAMLQERLPLPPVPMTSTERIASQREKLIQSARDKLPFARLKRDAVERALDEMKIDAPAYYTILTMRYVEGKKPYDIRHCLAIRGVDLTRDEYNDTMKKAFEMFEKVYELVL